MLGPAAMNWKATAVVWGAGVLATWYAALPPGTTTGAPAQSAAPAVGQVAPARSEIEREADRLQGQLRRQASFIAPVRNPFRFTPRVDTPTYQAPPLTGPSPIDAPPLMVLVGIAADETADGMARTAILTTSGGVVLAREGDAVGERYRVERIEEASVTLLDLPTQTTLRLAFRP